MSRTDKISFNQQREFGEVFSASIRFLKQNFKELFKSVLYLAGPFLLLSILTSVFYQYDMLSTVGGGMDTAGGASLFGSPYEVYNGLYFFNLFFQTLTYVVMLGVVIAYCRLYEARGLGGFEVNDVGRVLLKDAGLLLLTLLMVSVSLGIVGLAIGFTFAGIAQAGVGAGVIVGILLFLGLLIVLPPIMFWSTAVFFAVLNDRRGVFDAMSRSWVIMKRSFWWTWLIVFVTLLCFAVLSGIFMVPVVIIAMIYNLNSMSGNPSDLEWLITGFTIAAGVLGAMLYTVMYLIFGFHYFSEVEKKDGLGLMERIQGLGSGQTYRDVEEGY